MKISGSQIFWLMFSMEFGMTALLTMTPALSEAKQDAWISLTIAGMVALGITFLAIQLSRLFPNQTLVSVSQTILGKWLGKIVIIPYFVMWYSIMSVVLRQFADFTLTILLHTTPLWVPILFMIIVMVYVTHQGGIEGIGRTSEVLGPIILVSIAAILLLNIPSLDLSRMMPIYFDSGWLAILKGSLAPTLFLGESVMLTMLAPFLNQPDRISRALWGVSAASLLLVMSMLAVTMIFGASLSGKMWYPFFEMTRFISVMEFIQNIDIVIVVVWIFSVFVKLSLYLFIASYGTAEWFGIKDWRKIIWVVVGIVFILSLLSPNIAVTSDFPKKFSIPYMLPINMVGIPLLLWAIGLIRKKWIKA